MANAKGFFKKISNSIFNLKHPYTSAVITVGGSGTRMMTSDGVTKQFMSLMGIPVVARTLTVFQNCQLIDEIVIVAKEDEKDFYKALIDDYDLTKVSKITIGGETRQQSVLNGFKAISDEAEFVAIHDGVRCLITEENITETIKAAYGVGAAIAGTKIYDTVKMTNFSGNINSTIDRDKLMSAQTPQVFNCNIYRACAFSAKKDGFIATDDAMLCEKYGFAVKVVDCGRENIKITTQDDLLTAETILKKRSNTMKNTGDGDMRIGHGYDVHRLVENRKLILGGVEIPHELGLLGHSDADVLLHAIMDAVLGAAALGDIGLHFPDTDIKYKGISSVILANKVSELVTEKGFNVSNIDATIIAQKPKLRPFIDSMTENVAKAFKVDKTQVNIKATTEEKLGFTGNEEGIACHAVCIINKI